MILILDNRDSFTFNLAQVFLALGHETRVLRSDLFSAREALALQPDAIVLSPGPGRPTEAGCLLELIKHAPRSVPILGVCLGHQALAEAAGARIVQAKEIYHGRCAGVLHQGTGLFEGLANPLVACRYHSLVIQEDSLPDCYIADAHCAEQAGVIMSIRHRELPRFGVQFHPESFRSAEGPELLARFAKLASKGLSA